MEGFVSRGLYGKVESKNDTGSKEEEIGLYELTSWF